MQSEGPYRIRNDREEDVFISGPGLFESGEFPSGNFEYDQICAGLNTAYAEGRKAAEKDFQELLELANEASYFNQDIMGWRMKYADWKKARGIE